MEDFEPFQKIARLSRDIVITEKIDGTNAQIFIEEVGSIAMRVCAGSRSQWITPLADNFGFAAWVQENREELLRLGPGRHYGEWWGQGIQRRYDQTRKRFSLFNTSRWDDDDVRPACCDVVPTLYRGPFEQGAWERQLELLATKGSVAAPGFMKPEGIIIFHTQGNLLFKKTLERDAEPKSIAQGG